jgi:hypothetical protein
MSSSFQTFITFLANFGVPLFIFIKYSWWLGLISFVLAFLLNSGIGWFLVLKTDLTEKPFVPYLKMFIVSIILILFANLLS